MAGVRNKLPLLTAQIVIEAFLILGALTFAGVPVAVVLHLPYAGVSASGGKVSPTLSSPEYFVLEVAMLFLFALFGQQSFRLLRP